MPSNNNNNEKKVIVFGATGPVGSKLVEIIASQQPEWKISAVTRNKSTSQQKFPPQVTVVEGDVEDRERVLELTKDVDIIYSSVGFPKYERKYWAQHWPVVIENLLQAVLVAKEDGDDSSAKQLVFCDNLYAYGFNHDEPKMSTSSATVEASLKSKPAIRSWMRQAFAKHMQEHPQTLTVIGGADFFGPGVTNASFLGDTFTRKLVQGQKPLCMGSPKVIHDFCYVPDFANAMYVASINSTAALDHFWIAPHAVHDKTIQDVANDVQAIIDKQSLQTQTTKKPDNVKITVLSRGMVSVLSFFMGFMSEMKEMMDSWTKPYRIDDSEFCTTFSVQATPYEQALTEYVDFYSNLIIKEEQEKTNKH